MMREDSRIMITNEREYRISKGQLLRIREATKLFDVVAAEKRTGSKVLAKAELAALKSENEVLSSQIREYEALKAGKVSVFKAESLSELPDLLIQARIAQGLSQRQLAGRLDLKEQQIQRYEAERYASASLRRLTEVSEALELNISEVAELRPVKPRFVGAHCVSSRVSTKGCHFQKTP
jgi:HTH-type transcriptional regulator/antitoxin HigA